MKTNPAEKAIVWRQVFMDRPHLFDIISLVWHVIMYTNQESKRMSISNASVEKLSIFNNQIILSVEHLCDNGFMQQHEIGT